MALRSKSQELRIIGGKWKGRKLRFTGDDTLRPTLGRTRETLFNWLRAEINDSRCLDLFAGSGALSFEALSQGAGQVIMIEKHPASYRSLVANAALLDCASDCQLHRLDARQYLRQPNVAPCDIVFIDAPFAQPKLAVQSLATLLEQDLVRRYIYLEAKSLRQIESIVADHACELYKDTRTGDTHACLLRPKVTLLP